MSPDAVGQLIGAYGFPIVACGALFWYIVKEQRETRKVLGELKDLIESNTDVTRSFVATIKEVFKDGK